MHRPSAKPRRWEDHQARFAGHKQARDCANPTRARGTQGSEVMDTVQTLIEDAVESPNESSTILVARAAFPVATRGLGRAARGRRKTSSCGRDRGRSLSQK